MTRNWTRLEAGNIRPLLGDESGRSAVSFGIIACVLGLIVVVAIGFVSGAVQPR